MNIRIYKVNGKVLVELYVEGPMDPERTYTDEITLEQLQGNVPTLYQQLRSTIEQIKKAP